MMRWEKFFWALLAGAAIGTAGCGDDTGEPGDAPGDSMEVLGDVPHDTAEEEPAMTAYGPLPDY